MYENTKLKLRKFDSDEVCRFCFGDTSVICGDTVDIATLNNKGSYLIIVTNKRFYILGQSYINQGINAYSTYYGVKSILLSDISSIGKASVSPNLIDGGTIKQGNIWRHILTWGAILLLLGIPIIGWAIALILAVAYFRGLSSDNEAIDGINIFVDGVTYFVRYRKGLYVFLTEYNSDINLEESSNFW